MVEVPKGANSSVERAQPADDSGCNGVPVGKRLLAGRKVCVDGNRLEVSAQSKGNDGGTHKDVGAKLEPRDVVVVGTRVVGGGRGRKVL